ncbi:uncharacterized protein LOC143464990 [Clavelina lepadiformis]|uniref:Ephrin RBD domain-containing protein n=1 Tax=Clavelina lepadiformis TaxID=159417 RepID=A0ABP0EXY5_CLALP
MMLRMKMEKITIVAIVLSLVINMPYCTVVEGKTLDPIYWNSSNPMFRGISRRNIDASINDKLDIICPRSGRNDGEKLFYFKIYLVSEENYQTCNIHGGRRLITCDHPEKEKKYTFYFQEISPSPWGLEFEPHKSYYVVSTSDGSEPGIDLKQGGVCTQFNMKLEMKMHESETPLYPDYVETPPIKILPPKKTTTHSTPPDKKNSPPNNVEETEDKDEHKPEHNNYVPEPNDEGEKVSGNGLIIGIALGACAVLFIVLLILLGYKMYRRRRHLKKYQSPPLSPTCSTTPLQQVTLLPIAPHSHHRERMHSDHDRTRSATIASHTSLRPPPSYNESFMDNGGPVVAV